MPRFELKIGCTPQELQAAQKLRFQVFNLEMKAGLASSYEKGLDQDEFDELCEHIVIFDADTSEVVGTYRMLLDARALNSRGFYSQKEFQLNRLLGLEGGKLEVGRSCIHKDYRRRSVLNLLWQGIARYAMQNHVRYIFGCASVFSMDPKKISELLGALKFLGYFRDLDIFPINRDHFLEIDERTEAANALKIFDDLPALFKGYMNLGLKVCGYPSVDKEFRTTDFFILLDIKNMNPLYKQRLFGNYLEEDVVIAH